MAPGRTGTEATRPPHRLGVVDLGLQVVEVRREAQAGTIHAAAGARGLGHFKPLRPEGQACWPQLRRWLMGSPQGESTDPEASNDGDRTP